jgi:fucose 4-O-acetylase-like acetyltransferase
MEPATPTTVAKPRYAFVDLAKGICIMLVVWHHVVSTWGLETYPLKETVSTFRMPLYFFLSGLFFKEYAGFFDFSRRKINKLLIPFAFFFVTLTCILPFVLHCLHLRGNPGAAVWYSFVWKQSFPNIPVWFLLSLFWTNLMFYGLYLVAKKVVARKFPQYATSSLVVLSVALGLVGFFLGRYNIKLPLFWASSMASIPYFCAGHVAYRYTKLLAPNRLDRWNIPFAFLCFGLVVALAWNAPPDSVSYVSNRYWFPIWSVYLCGILGTLAVLFFSKAIKKLPLVSYFGRFSIMVLVTHGWVQWGIIKILQENHVHWPRPVALAFVFVVTMLLYLGIIPLMKRFLPHVTAQKDVF